MAAAKPSVESLPQTTWIEARHDPSLSSTNNVAPFMASRNVLTQPATTTVAPTACAPRPSSSLSRSRLRAKVGVKSVRGSATAFFATGEAFALAAAGFFDAGALPAGSALSASFLASAPKILEKAGAWRHVRYHRSNEGPSLLVAIKLPLSAARSTQTTAQSAADTRSPARYVVFCRAASSVRHAC